MRFFYKIKHKPNQKPLEFSLKEILQENPVQKSIFQKSVKDFSQIFR